MATQGRKSAKKPPVAVIVTVLVIVLIIAITLVVIYFAAPSVWNKITEPLLGNNKQTENSTSTDDTPTPDPTPDPPPNPNPNPNPLVTGDGDLAFHMLDIGQGDWLLILLPDGKEMVVDAGSKPGSTTTYNSAKAYMDNYITDGQIDYVILTHSDQDHVEYMDELFNDYQVSNLYIPALYSTPSNASLAEQVAAIPATKTQILDDSGVNKTKCSIETATDRKSVV